MPNVVVHESPGFYVYDVDSRRYVSGRYDNEPEALAAKATYEAATGSSTRLIEF